MTKFTKTLTLVAASSLLSLSMSGCQSSSSTPSDKTIQSAINKDLNYMFRTNNNHGKVFTVSNLKLNDITEEKKINAIDKKNTRYVAHVSFTVRTDGKPAKILSLTNSKKIINLGYLNKGETKTLTGISAEMVKNKNGVHIESLQ